MKTEASTTQYTYASGNEEDHKENCYHHRISHGRLTTTAEIGIYMATLQFFLKILYFPFCFFRCIRIHLTFLHARWKRL